MTVLANLRGTVNRLLRRGRATPLLAPAEELRAAPPDPELVERIRTVAGREGWPLFPLGESWGVPGGLGLTPGQRDLAAEQMWDDEAVKTGVLQKCFGVMPLNLSASPEDPASAADHDAAEFARWALCERVEGGLPGVIWSLLHCLRGHVVCEPVWRTKQDSAEPDLESRGRWAGKHTLSALKAKPKSSYRLEVDDYANVRGVTAGGTFIPKTSAGRPGVVHVAYLPPYESPWGRSDYDAAIRYWLFKLASWRLRKLYLDRLVGPFLWAKMGGAVDASGRPTAKALALTELLRAARSCGVIVTDMTDDVQVIDLAAGTDEQFSKGQQDANSAILMNFTGAYLHTMEGKNPDARGNAQVSMNVSEGHQWYLRARVEVVLNQQVGPLLVKRNFADAGYPKFVLEVVNPAYASAMLAVGTLVRQAGLTTSKKQWHTVSGWQEPADAEDTVPGGVAPTGAPGGQSPGGPGQPPGVPDRPGVLPKVPPEGNDPYGGEKP